MKIISLNTWMGIVKEPLMEFFTAHNDVDIFCLQEVHRNAQGKATPHPEYDIDFSLFEDIQEILKDTHIGYFEPAVEDWYGLATFVRKGIPVLEHGSAPIFSNPDWKKDGAIEQRGFHSRILQYVQLKELLLINVHGMWRHGTLHEDIPERIEQSNRIKAFLSDHPGSTVLLGDFNLGIDTESLAMLDEGMKNLVKEYHIASTRTRFYPKDDLYADYAIVSPAINVTDFKVLPDEVSDHAALFLEIA